MKEAFIGLEREEDKIKFINSFYLCFLMREYIQDAFKKKGKVELAGWIHEKRDLGKIKYRNTPPAKS